MANSLQDPKLLAKWQPSIENLFTSKKNFSFVRLISMSPRNLLLLAADNTTDSEVVFKVAPINGCLFSEIVSLSRVSHPNIVALKQWWSDGGSVFVELEYVPGKCVIDMVVSQGRLSEQLVHGIFKQVTGALLYLHTKGLVHRDVKPDNFIYNPETEHTKLIDFELSTHYERGNKLSQRSGTIHYLSPEVRRQCYEGPECDAWSLGVTLYVMLSGQFPFSNDELWSYSDQFKELNIPYCTEYANDLIRQLTKQEVSKRLTVEEALEHKWVKIGDKKEVKYSKSFNEQSKTSMIKVVEKFISIKK